ncbi:hypothetical protein F5X97DRAFT_289531 [Nemania serpens]|nr:hypothetical protein F5X97DRAFT_289531 [Nemania serpens]
MSSCPSSPLMHMGIGRVTRRRRRLGLIVEGFSFSACTRSGLSIIGARQYMPCFLTAVLSFLFQDWTTIVCDFYRFLFTLFPFLPFSVATAFGLISEKPLAKTD